MRAPDSYEAFALVYDRGLGKLFFDGVRPVLDRLDRFFAAHAELFAWHRPKAGSIAFPLLLNERVDRFCDALVAKQGVLLLPGTLYGPEYNAFRIGFGRKTLPEALDRFAAFLRSDA